MDSFPCTKCGLCCKQLANTLTAKHSLPQKLQDLISIFPYRPKPDGSCPKLTEDGLCSVYETRPIICNIDLSSKLFNYNITDWYRINAENCNILINNAGLSTDYLVKIEESTKETPKTYEEGRISPRKRRRRKNSAKRKKSP
tara:strand:+ start:108 stop:533 length:426 start_codon:yes stop_codon:yes gene_type:complete